MKHEPKHQLARHLMMMVLIIIMMTITRIMLMMTMGLIPMMIKVKKEIKPHNRMNR